MKAKIKLQNKTFLLDSKSREILIKKHGDATKIFDVVIQTSQRSVKENRMYRGFLRWLADNLPEGIENHLKKSLKIQKVTDKLLHELFKCRFNKITTAFESMPETEFNDYFNDVVEMVATIWLKCAKESMLEQSRNYIENDRF